MQGGHDGVLPLPPPSISEAGRKSGHGRGAQENACGAGSCGGDDGCGAGEDDAPYHPQRHPKPIPIVPHDAEPHPSFGWGEGYVTTPAGVPGLPLEGSGLTAFDSVSPENAPDFRQDFMPGDEVWLQPCHHRLELKGGRDA